MRVEKEIKLNELERNAIHNATSVLTDLALLLRETKITEVIGEKTGDVFEAEELGRVIGILTTLRCDQNFKSI